MTQSDTVYAPVRRSNDAGVDGAEGAGAPNPLLIVHSLLRGRYVLAAVLALLGSAGGAVVGYYAKKPDYQSVGVIRIKPSIPSNPITGQDRLMPAFEVFVKSQIAFLQGERVITRAMEKPEWQAVRPGMSPADIVSFRSKLEVTYDRGELVSVMFTDVDPLVAMRGAQCVTTSYLELYANAESDDGEMRLEVLQKLRTEYSNTLRAKTAAIAEYAGSDIDPDSLQKLYDFYRQETNTRESDWNEARRLLAATDTAEPMTAGGQPPAPTTAPVELTPREIALTDHGMRQLLADQRAAEKALTLARSKYGSAHHAVAEAEQRLKMAGDDVTEYAETYRREAAMRNGGAVARTPEELALQALRHREQNLRRLYEEGAAKTKELGQKVVAIQSLKREADAVEQMLEETKNAIRQIELQSNFGGRISALSTGDQPLAPFEDKRTKLAAAGAFGGGGMGVALVLAFGFLNRRLVSVHDARLGIHRVDRMLGVLPHVPTDLSDTEQAAVAAHCVHHIRTLLQLEPHLPSRRVYSVTSPSPGDGKTTLTIALGMSFAASGAKTLLLDCDIIGGGLSSKMDQMIRPKLGRVLVREGLMTEDQLQQALAAAKREGRALGEILVEQGLVSVADVAHAAAVQGQSYVGLLDVLAGEPLADCITGTGRSGLFVLPIGSAGAHHASQLSPLTLQAILTEARSSFDVVLVDTGPILGSLEAAMAAAQSDGVVLAVSRGVPQALVRRSLDRLIEVGANVVGMVLNRAAAREVSEFAFSSGSVRSHSARRLPAPEGQEPQIRLGSVGEAIAASDGKGRR